VRALQEERPHRRGRRRSIQQTLVGRRRRHRKITVRDCVTIATTRRRRPSELRGICIDDQKPMSKRKAHLVRQRQRARSLAPTARFARSNSRTLQKGARLSARARDLRNTCSALSTTRRASARRRDEMAFCLSKIVATALPKMGAESSHRNPGEKGPQAAGHTTCRRRNRRKSRQGTAQKGSKWDGLLKRQLRTRTAGDEDDDDDDETTRP